MLDNFKMNGIKFIMYNPLKDEHFDYLKEFDIKVRLIKNS